MEVVQEIRNWKASCADKHVFQTSCVGFRVFNSWGNVFLDDVGRKP
jgi:hypothetical protein